MRRNDGSILFFISIEDDFRVTFFNRYINQKTKAAPLAVFRILFGLMMLVSVVRFWSKGWIEKLYIEPAFFFSYYGFEWVKPLGNYTYLLFIICGISAICISIGYRYTLSIIVFFLSFTYIELMDKTTYLNHYYFITVLSFFMIFLPASAYFSVDARKKGSTQLVPQWTIDSIKLVLFIVYFYAGLAKLNSDWLVEAMPLKIWLPSNYDLPIIGDLLQQEWAIYVFSWSGAIYDLSIPFLLFWKRSRTIAFVLVVVFHVLTLVLFPIGMFPYIMIVSAMIFFDSSFHEKVISKMKNLLLGILSLSAWLAGAVRNLFFVSEKRSKTERFLPMVEMTKCRIGTKLNVTEAIPPQEEVRGRSLTPQWKIAVISTFFIIQLLLPWRYLLYSDELFWTEEGYRFSWRVMLIEKAGYANFKIVNPASGDQFNINNSDFLTSFQEKQMATQPDFILEYAHFLASKYKSVNQGVEVYVESYVALNGRRSKPFINPKVNLAAEKESIKKKQWILPFEDEIKGL
jgi:hypothetical protein